MKIRTSHCFAFLAMAVALTAATDPAVKLEIAPRYDKATEIDMMATVSDTKEVSRDSPLIGVYLMARTESDAPLDVYLGPADFIKSFEIVFRKGNQIHIIGSKVKLGSATVILAREVRRSESTLYLRDAKGEPYWTSGGK